MNALIKFFIIIISAFFSFCFAASITVPMYTLDNNQPIGNVIFQDSKSGMLITPDLKQLSPGIHGLHIHQNPSCEQHGDAAGAHLDPEHTDKHLGPYGHGHLGDLPALVVNADGTATLPIFAPRLDVATIKNHALLIHAGGDNYSDTPEKLGGGGKRFACGVIK